ncbi:GNAT family N-acetyltransferase [Rhodophyticola sp. CCM32]|uniref:GNAT family N-acetyltransferase n=1 Tax=Rhodophyticola sp. CCM32 TaxID=2916397 RepID=UPI00107F5D77|nr:GNAT family N-acetyltransferase [Rhodophyticola sp. CCM32]QBY02406.1 GNAT family N-acetyltransferase [Rhodophyticola sp. CCM32]
MTRNLHIRPAHGLDTNGMAELLCQIIRIGGTTAMTRPVTAVDIAGWMARAPGKSAWHVAEDATGQILGFQWIEPAEYLPPEAAEIATFVAPGRHGLGIGSNLFRATQAAARDLGYAWINANIRADNSSGLTYYQSRGFEDYGVKPGFRLENGQTVDKVLKRYALD